MRQFILLLLTIVIASCNSSTTTDSQAEKSKDSVDSKHFIDSLSNSDAVLFDKALQMEKDSADEAISIYEQIADRLVNKTVASYIKAPYYV